ncbi:MAG: nucleotidyltransferase family protein [Oscillospiraceae bacterium]|nr:nucleotidyltransferase family protein [Oscillospiraceae bacterium]
MKVTGIICEYNPLHLGHKKQIDTVRALQGADSGIVCLMSGSFVQRGAPAIVDKSLRAKAAILCGADLVLELPVTVSLSSAEGFAAGGVRILAPFCSHLCFGAETADPELLLSTARVLLSEEFPEALHLQLDKGLSFPAARQAALEAMGINSDALSHPNGILAVEYCKAILSQKTAMAPLPIHRSGSYHDLEADLQNPSATAVRRLMVESGAWLDYVPAQARTCFADAAIHTLSAGERAILGQLRRMTEADFEALPYGSEGLWRKLMHAARECSTLEGILASVKSKRYTMTRLSRMLMCAFLGITKVELETPAPYVRALAFNDRGRDILRTARQSGIFPNTGEKIDSPYQTLENRCGDLYGLFAQGAPEPPGAETSRRVFYLA